MIALVDYGAGNITSVRKAFEFLGAPCRVTSDASDVAAADRIVLPGVGHFSGTLRLERNGLLATLQEQIDRGKPFLGICVGMQWMFAGSTEAPGVRALALLAGECERFAPGIKSPHVGWNTISIRRSSRLLRDVDDGTFFYYTHSYRAPVTDFTVADTEHGGAFSAIVERGNAFGVQFHPEKSGAAGLRLLRNFCELPC